MYVEFHMSNVTVPTQKTTYMCQSFTLPVVEDAHIIQVVKDALWDL